MQSRIDTLAYFHPRESRLHRRERFLHEENLYGTWCHDSLYIGVHPPGKPEGVLQSDNLLTQ